MNVFRILAPLALAACLLGCGQQKDDHDPAAFYPGKTVTIVVGYPTGGGHDAAARLVARHIGKHIPGHPQVIVQNMPGAGTLVGINYVHNSAPRDGTVFGIGADPTHLMPLMGDPSANFDPREVSFIGALSERATPIVFVRSDAPATSLEEATGTEVTLGTAGRDFSAIYPKLSNALLGTKFKSISGYVGGPEIMLAIERGEVHGRAGYSWKSMLKENPDWISKKFVTVILQLGMKPSPDLAGVPIALELAKTEEDRQIMELIFGTTAFAYQFAGPPDVPAERLAAIRKAFKDMTADPAFLEEATKVLVERVQYKAPEEITAFYRRAYSLPPRVIERTAAFMDIAPH